MPGRGSCSAGTVPHPTAAREPAGVCGWTARFSSLGCCGCCDCGGDCVGADREEDSVRRSAGCGLTELSVGGAWPAAGLQHLTQHTVWLRRSSTVDAAAAELQPPPPPKPQQPQPPGIRRITAAAGVASAASITGWWRSDVHFPERTVGASRRCHADVRVLVAYWHGMQVLPHAACTQTARPRRRPARGTAALDLDRLRSPRPPTYLRQADATSSSCCCLQARRPWSIEAEDGVDVKR
eukprot:363711-Chlamydomonas_euryale.AAC.4